MTDGPLSGVIVAFDVDNTLLDPTGESYRRTVTEFLSQVDLGLPPDEAYGAYEGVRSHGYALERLGLANPIHHRGHPHALALMCITYGADPALLFELGIKHDERTRGLALLFHLAELHDARRAGPPADRLKAEMLIRGIVDRGLDAQRFRAEVERVAGHRIIAEWAAAYARIERSHESSDPGELIRGIASRGGTPVIISEGQWALQRRKLADLGVASLVSGRALITEAAAQPPALADFELALSDAITAHQEHRRGDVDENLVLLWYYRCVLDDWSAKTPAFYGRCLHALRANAHAAEEALRNFAFVGARDWRENPLRFVMVGDRYDRDVEPLIDLLGAGRATTIRLTQGKYGDQHPSSALPPDKRPFRSIPTWDALCVYLEQELIAEDVISIDMPPAILHGVHHREDLIERGLSSSLAAVRTVAGTLNNEHSIPRLRPSATGGFGANASSEPR